MQFLRLTIEVVTDWSVRGGTPSLQGSIEFTSQITAMTIRVPLSKALCSQLISESGKGLEMEISDLILETGRALKEAADVC